MFSFDTVQNFDNHIENSIPAYNTLFETLVSISSNLLIPNTNFIDIGCSTGKLLETIRHDGTKIGIDTSKHLLPRHYETNTAEYFSYDVTEYWGYDNCSLITSIFTLQFIDKNKRQDLLNRIYEGLVPNGAFIWAEKVYAESGQMQDIMTTALHEHKRTYFDAMEILDKDADLRSMMRLNTSLKNEEMAREAGFDKRQLIWKALNFEAWLYIK
jgi:tRNA (cmo5U34)-methyltransferase